MSGELTLELDRVLPASRPVVYAVVARADELAKWWGPRGFTIPSATFAPRVGDAYRIEMQPPEGEAFHLTGEFREVDPPGRLSFTFVWEPADSDDVETVVDLRLGEVGEATKLDLTQGRFKTEERLELHRGGWTDSLDKLELLVSSRG